MPDNRFDQGMRIRRAILGDAHVDRREAEKTDFDANFQRFITENIWGDVWRGDALDRRDRSLITLALLTALGQQEELAMHIRATENTGVTREELRELLLHVAAYVGVPAGNAAFKTAKQVLEADQGA